MDQDPRTAGPPVAATPAGEGDADRTPEEIRADIEQTRQEVGDTVEALARKSDVKGQAQQRIADAKANVRRKREELGARAKSTTPQSGQQIVTMAREHPAPLAIGGAVLAGFVLGRMTGRRSP
jgi:ElaB/YqjD/DUF883 family membrane-anchored ribosome-binding protein